MEKDPVCMMDVDENTASYKATVRGKTYYFCSEYCYRIFDRIVSLVYEKKEI